MKYILQFSMTAILAAALCALAAGTAFAGEPASESAPAAPELKPGSSVAELAAIVNGDGAFSDKIAALAALEKLGNSSAIPLLIPGLDQRDDHTALAIENTLGVLAGKGGGSFILTRELSRGIANASPRAQWHSASILKNLGTYEAESALMPLLYSREIQPRCEAIQALGFAGTRPEAYRAILAALRCGEPAVMKYAAMTLGKMRCTEAIPDFIAFLDHPDKLLRKTAWIALQNTTGMNFSAESAGWKQWWQSEKSSSEQNLNRAVNEIKAAPPDLAPAAIETLEAIIYCRPKVVDFVLPLLNNPDFRVRAAVCNVLAESADARAIAPLVNALRDSRPEVSAGAWRGLVGVTGKTFERDFNKWNTWLQQRG